MAKSGQSYSKNLITSFKRLLNRRVLAHQIISPELASEMAELSCKTNTSVACLLDRRGKVQQYFIGALSQIKDIKAQAAREGTRKLAQLRLIVASPTNSVSKEELLLLKQYNLDALLFIHACTNSSFSKASGMFLEFADYGELCLLCSEAQGWKVHERQAIRQLAQLNFSDIVQEVEEQLASNPVSLEVRNEERAILVALNNKQDYEDSLAELHGLATTAGAQIKSTLIQSLVTPDPRYFIGSGKLVELRHTCLEEGIELVIFDGELSPAQVRNIEREIGGKVKVIDRSELILDIFAQRARSEEGKLQVELAQLKYLAPRLSGSGTSLSKLGGGIGTRGPGETKLEVQRRNIKERIIFLERRVAEISRTRELQRRRRKQHGIALVSLAGYTNAGKSTLFNALTKSDVLAENKLFATLDPTIRQVNRSAGSYLVSDTVGFIQNLPTTLIDAFKATLEEIQESNLILNVVDIHHPNRIEHLHVIADIFAQLGLNKINQLLVFNKSDLIADSELTILKETYPDAFFVSAQTKNGISNLLDAIEKHIF